MQEEGVGGAKDGRKRNTRKRDRGKGFLKGCHEIYGRWVIRSDIYDRGEELREKVPRTA